MAASGGMWIKSPGSALGRKFVPRGGAGAGGNARVELRPRRRREGTAFPGELGGLKTVKSLGGSTGAKLVEDAAGNRYVMKRGKSAGHLLEEGYADAAYHALGVDVPQFRIYQTPNGPVKLSRYLRGDLVELGSLHGETKQAVRADLRKNFVADALLGNYDVIGMGADNILWDGSKAWRVDNGGSLRYRAQGKLKSDWGEYPTQLWTMRDKSINYQAAKVFGPLSMAEISAQIAGISPAQRKAVLAALPAELRPTVSARIGHLQHVATSYKTLTKAGVSSSKADTFLRRYVEGRAKGTYQEASGSELMALYHKIGG